MTNGRDLYRCKICGMVFTSKADLKSHRESPNHQTRSAMATFKARGFLPVRTSASVLTSAHVPFEHGRELPVGAQAASAKRHRRRYVPKIVAEAISEWIAFEPEVKRRMRLTEYLTAMFKDVDWSKV